MLKSPPDRAPGSRSSATIKNPPYKRSGTSQAVPLPAGFTSIAVWLRRSRLTSRARREVVRPTPLSLREVKRVPSIRSPCMRSPSTVSLRTLPLSTNPATSLREMRCLSSLGVTRKGATTKIATTATISNHPNGLGSLNCLSIVASFEGGEALVIEYGLDDRGGGGTTTLSPLKPPALLSILSLPEGLSPAPFDPFGDGQNSPLCKGPNGLSLADDRHFRLRKRKPAGPFSSAVRCVFALPASALRWT